MLTLVHAPAFAGIRDAILAQARTLPVAPQVLAGICELLQDANTDLGQIAAEIRLDPTLAARVIQMSNSVAFGSGQRAGSIEEAVGRVGFRDVLRLVGVATVAGLVDRSLGSFEIAAERMRESLLFHALASEALAVHSELDGRTAYSAGLLRTLGMMTLDRVGRGLGATVEAFDEKRYGTYERWEVSTFGVSSPDVTSFILEEWRFPTAVVAALRLHRLLTDKSYEDRFACLLNLAGAIVAEHGFALVGDVGCWTLKPEKLEAAGMDEGSFHAAARQAAALFARQRSLLY